MTQRILGVESMVQPPHVPTGLLAVLATRPARLISLLEVSELTEGDVGRQVGKQKK
jgi:hypothetical protein